MNILLNLQSHPEGSRFHVKCLSHKVGWNQTDEQDLYLVSSETGWIKNDMRSKPRVFGLVLEFGGMNLATFLRDPLHSPARFGSIPRVNILRDIVSAMEFLESCRIVHGDLKPENIVSFHSTGNGLTCWKLIDFDNSHDLSSRPPPKIDLQTALITPEYIAPELATALRDVNSRRLNPNSPSPLITLIEPSLKMDIWSLGVVSVFVFKGQSLWELYSPFSSHLDFSPIIEFDEDHFNRTWLSDQVGQKEKSFIEKCLRVNPSDRLSASGLKRRTIFSTSQSTISVNVRETTTAIRNQLVELTRLVDQGVTAEQLDGRFADALTIVLSQIENATGI